MKILWPQMMLFGIDSVIVTLLQCVWIMFMMSFFYPHTLWSTRSQDSKHLEASTKSAVCWTNRKRIHLGPSDNTFRKLDFILCSTLMRLVVSIITFLWNCWQLHNSPVVCIQQNSAIAMLDGCEYFMNGQQNILYNLKCSCLTLVPGLLLCLR